MTHETTYADEIIERLEGCIEMDVNARHEWVEIPMADAVALNRLLREWQRGWERQGDSNPMYTNEQLYKANNNGRVAEILARIDHAQSLLTWRPK